MISASVRPQPQRMVVTGGAGFLGSHLVRSYLASGTFVRAIGRHNPDTRADQSSRERFEFVELDLCEAGNLADAFGDHDIVIHTAALTHAQGPQLSRLQERVNVEATRNVIDACRKSSVPMLVHVSSTAAIGISPDPAKPADETFPYNLSDLGLTYSVTKHRAERLVLDASGSGLETLVVNPGFMFGNHRGRYRGEEIIARVLQRPVVTYTSGGLSIVHVDDVVDGIRKVIERGQPSERYILSGDNCSFREIAKTVCRCAGVRRVMLSVPDLVRDLAGQLGTLFGRDGSDVACRHLSDACAYPFYNSDKARRTLGYRPRSFEMIVTDYLQFRNSGC
jgi:dihydroflavonol-4-reductase